MKRIKIEKEIRCILERNDIDLYYWFKEEAIKKKVKDIKKLIYNNYRRRK